MSDLERQHFLQLVPAAPMLTTHESAQVLRVTGRTVLRLIEAGKLGAFEINAGGGERITRRIPRTALALYLLQVRTYDLETYLAGVVGLMRTLSPLEVKLVEEATAAYRARSNRDPMPR